MPPTIPKLPSCNSRESRPHKKHTGPYYEARGIADNQGEAGLVRLWEPSAYTPLTQEEVTTFFQSTLHT